MLNKENNSHKPENSDPGMYGRKRTKHGAAGRRIAIGIIAFLVIIAFVLINPFTRSILFNTGTEEGDNMTNTETEKNNVMANSTTEDPAAPIKAGVEGNAPAVDAGAKENDPAINADTGEDIDEMEETVGVDVFVNTEEEGKNIKITALGLGAAKISSPVATVYVDAFFQEPAIAPFDSSDADIILITHDHADHFVAKTAAEAAMNADAIIVGPPSIAYPLLVDNGFPADRLVILHSDNPHKPDSFTADNVTISSFSSRHFDFTDDTNKMTVHNSYLLELDDKRIYICGDSYEISTQNASLVGVDAILYNLVDPMKDYDKIAGLGDVVKVFKPKCLIPMHIIGCNWTFSAQQLDREIERLNLKRIIIFDNSGDFCVL